MVICAKIPTERRRSCRRASPHDKEAAARAQAREYALKRRKVIAMTDKSHLVAAHKIEKFKFSRDSKQCQLSAYLVCCRNDRRGREVRAIKWG